MTEAEWLTCTDPMPMLAFLRTKVRVSDRKVLLFNAACCCFVWHLLGDRQHRKLVRLVEHYADSQATEGAIEKARRDAYYASAGERRPAVRSAQLAAGSATSPGAVSRVIEWVSEAFVLEDEDLMAPVERTPLHAVLRDIISNPFRPSPLLPPTVLAWHDRTICRIAEGIYVERTFDRLPILHDALLDAGCDDETILSHCRSEGPHVRGCWVIDLILGKL